MITDMERIGDQAADICEIMLSVKDTLPIEKVAHMDKMAQATVKMVNGAIDAFVERDVKFAREVMKEDDIVDNLFDMVRDELLVLIRKDEIIGEKAIDLLMIAKYYERIGDHAQNIAEWVEYSITGVLKGEPLG
jgi:phosphate transport system protein